ncbi:MAG TPA: NnrU family protein [Burkholderiaceae bacterium]
MVLFIIGLVVFLGAHSTRIVADGWRSAQVARIGPGPWKGLYSLVSIAGFVALVWGYGMARAQPVPLWTPPPWTRHLAALLMIASFVLLAAAYVPRNGIRARLHHPMMLGVMVWALAHLAANGTLADVLLFGAFLAWAVAALRAARGRDRASGTVYPAGTAAGTATTVVVGIVAYGVFAFWLHALLIGVRPFG